MCGISIIVNKKNTGVDPSIIKAMNDMIVHRGPDDEGVFISGNFALGHRRLSILDLSSAGHQPMQRNGLWITYNGEVYNYIELREELKALGHIFHSATDTEVILAAYEEWGVDSFSKLNGMWAFAIYDASSSEIVFCRDHFGIKPLYITQAGDFFLAGSEIKQFTAVPGFAPKLNKKVAANFLVHGWLNYSEETFFRDVNELRPGYYLRYDLHSHRYEHVKWYDLDAACIPVKDSYETAVENLRKLFIDSVNIRMRSDVRVGSCLSGGIDSSSIVSVIHSNKLANGKFATVTSCYNDKRYDEQQFSDVVSNMTGYTAVKVFPRLNDLWDRGELDRIIYHQDQPIASASHYSEFKVFEKAREHGIIVMQDGQGSDEYLCGYGEFYVSRLKELIGSFKLKGAYDLLRKKAAHKNVSFFSELTSFVRTGYIHPRQAGIKKLVGRALYPWLSPEWKDIAGKSSVDFGRKNVRDLSIAEILYSSIPYQLHSEDRNSMLFSIESRLPFLDPRLVEYALALPSSYKIKDGYTKAVLRDALPELPEMIRYRKDKMGFVAPDPLWIRDNHTYVRAQLRELVDTTGIFSEELINRFDRFINGDLGYEPIYFRALTFKRFCDLFKISMN